MNARPAALAVPLLLAGALATAEAPTGFSTADVFVSKTLDTAGPYSAGQSITYTIQVGNFGPDMATGVFLTDTPTNLTIVNVTGACVSLPCALGTVSVGASPTVTVTATIDAPSAFDNSTTVFATEPDPNTLNNTDNTGNNGMAPVEMLDFAIE